MPQLSRRLFLTAVGGAAAVSAFGLPEVALGAPLASEDGYDLWLRYRPVEDAALLASYRNRLRYVSVPDGAGLRHTTRAELERGLSGMLAQSPTPTDTLQEPGTLVIGTPQSSDLVRRIVGPKELEALGPEGYLIRTTSTDGVHCTIVAGATDRAVLYGTFGLLRLLQTRQPITDLAIVERPANAIRMVNHWDNLNRTVERGYAGQSIFDWDALPELDPRYTDYARALASLGLNATVVNNVNANPTFLSSEFLPKLAALAGVLRDHGISLFLSANFACPNLLGDLPTSDPLDPAVKQWWKDKADEIYRAIPDFGGWLVKASSEGQPGPITYGRTHADGANTLAAAMEPHGGLVIYRAFVHGDVDTWTNDSWDEFHHLDGKFADNAIVQIKNGPMDFGNREPVHPLLGGMPNTNCALELQITQEYTGHSTHLNYLVSEWKQVLEFDTKWRGTGPLVREVVDGTAFKYQHSGFAGVINFGTDRNWTGHHLAAANTHGFGRLAWNPELSAEDLAREWVQMTFGTNKKMVQALSQLLLGSWETYDDYVCFLGQSYLMNGLGDHFSPDLPGTVAWHRATATGVGFDRTVATGSGYAGFYAPPNAAMYEDPATTPEELVLFFHHLPYTYRLRSGDTVIQHIYERHFVGAEEAIAEQRAWASQVKRIDQRRFEETAERFGDQVVQAHIWRDAVVGYFFEISRILDETRSWLQLSAGGGALLLGGWPNQFPVRIGNASPTSQTGAVSLRTPSGWDVGTGSFTVATKDFGQTSVPVTPPLEPGVISVSLSADANIPAIGTTPFDVVTAPMAGRCAYALDAGSESSPLTSGYARLSPSTAWADETGFGWIGAKPQSRDRGKFDALRRDFCCDRDPHTLRLKIPSGSSRVHFLIGDGNVTARGTTVWIDGQQVGDSGELPAGVFTWLHHDLDGGPSGRTIDVEFHGKGGEYWHLAGLALIDPDAPPKPAAVGTIQLAEPVIGGQDNAVDVEVISLWPEPVEVTVTPDLPAGWSGQPVTTSIAAGETATVRITLLPSTVPQDGTITLRTTSPAGPVANGIATRTVLAVPRGDQATYALDAGPVGSPVLAGYTALTPQSQWNEQAGFGWTAGTILDRDRNRIGVLRRDIVLSRDPATLRLRLPAGGHRAWILTGDAYAPGARTTITMDGQVVADSGPAPIPQGSFRWIDWSMSGGTAGADVDLTITGSEGDRYWRIASLIVMPE